MPWLDARRSTGRRRPGTVSAAARSSGSAWGPGSPVPVCSPPGRRRVSPSREGRWSMLSGIRSTPSIRPVPNSDSLGRLLNSFLDPLVWQPEPGKFVPGLATSWQVTPDATPLHLHAARGREVPRWDAVQRGGGQGHVRPDRRPPAEGAPDRAAGPLRRHGRPGRPPDPGEVQGAVPALPPLPQRARAPAGVSDRREEVGRRLRPEPRGHRPVRAHEVLPVGDHLRALRRLQLGARVPRPQGPGLPRQGGPALRAGELDPAHRAGDGRVAADRLRARRRRQALPAPIRSSSWT